MYLMPISIIYMCIYSICTLSIVIQYIVYSINVSSYNLICYMLWFRDDASAKEASQTMNSLSYRGSCHRAPCYHRPRRQQRPYWTCCRPEQSRSSKSYQELPLSSAPAKHTNININT